MEGDCRMALPMISLMAHFNPLPPHGGRLQKFGKPSTAYTFQSTPSAWRETISSLGSPAMVTYFNPLPPHGGRRKILQKTTVQLKFQSTPSAWRETQNVLIFLFHRYYFNPLPPHGGRQFTLLIWNICCIISIHSLRMEGDLPHLLQ